MPAQPDTFPATHGAPFGSGLAALRASTLALIAAALFAVLPAGPARSQSDPVIAKVNGVEIRESDLAMAEEDVGQNPQLQAMPPEARRDYMVSYLADVILAAKAAEGKKVADQKEFKGRLAFIRNKLLMETLLQQEGKAALTPDAMKKVYDEAVKQMGNEQEVRARHILVPTEDEAKAVLAEVKKGTDFAELARQKSKDPGAAAEGGDLGYFGKEQMVPEFAAVAYPQSYPMWRHAVFIIINTTFAAWFLQRPSWLIWPYAILVLQIFNGHGIDAWTLWLHERRIDWPSVVSVLGSMLGLWLLLVDRADRRRMPANL